METSKPTTAWRHLFHISRMTKTSRPYLYFVVASLYFDHTRNTERMWGLHLVLSFTWRPLISLLHWKSREAVLPRITQRESKRAIQLTVVRAFDAIPQWHEIYIVECRAADTPFGTDSLSKPIGFVPINWDPRPIATQKTRKNRQRASGPSDSTIHRKAFAVRELSCVMNIFFCNATNH